MILPLLGEGNCFKILTQKKESFDSFSGDGLGREENVSEIHISMCKVGRVLKRPERKKMLDTSNLWFVFLV